MGNQLPYISAQLWTNVTDKQTEMDMVTNRKVDHVHFHSFGLGDISTLVSNAVAGGYEVRLWDSGSGTGMVYYWNYDHPDDKKRALYRNPKFKQAMSLALDRPTIKLNVYIGYGTITTGTVSPKAIEFNYNDEARTRYAAYRDAYSTYSPTQANALLDSIGVVDVEPKDGWREYPDGSPLEVRIDISRSAPSQDCMDVLAIAKQNWQAIGLNIRDQHNSCR